MNGRYHDIIDLPHHRSKNRPHMSLHDRAAQFASFAALAGHGTAISETARITDRKIELDEDSKSFINDILNKLKERINEQIIEITYFVPDEKKAGGRYVTKTDMVRKIDDYKFNLLLSDDTVIQFDDILHISLL